VTKNQAETRLAALALACGADPAVAPALVASFADNHDDLGHEEAASFACEQCSDFWDWDAWGDEDRGDLALEAFSHLAELVLLETIPAV